MHLGYRCLRNTSHRTGCVVRRASWDCWQMVFHLVADSLLHCSFIWISISSLGLQARELPLPCRYIANKCTASTRIYTCMPWTDGRTQIAGALARGNGFLQTWIKLSGKLTGNVENLWIDVARTGNHGVEIHRVFWFCNQQSNRLNITEPDNVVE
jgi:hypothetical protein